MAAWVSQLFSFLSQSVGGSSGDQNKLTLLNGHKSWLCKMLKNRRDKISRCIIFILMAPICKVHYIK